MVGLKSIHTSCHSCIFLPALDGRKPGGAPRSHQESDNLIEGSAGIKMIDFSCLEAGLATIGSTVNGSLRHKLGIVKTPVRSSPIVAYPHEENDFHPRDS
jgi:hypothetical protein